VNRTKQEQESSAALHHIGQSGRLFDPEGCKRPPMFQGLAWMYQALEITFPLSTHRLLVLSHGEVGLSYLDVNDKAVTELNRRTRGYCRSCTQDAEQPPLKKCAHQQREIVDGTALRGRESGRATSQWMPSWPA
jgi:hypothetical protein